MAPFPSTRRRVPRTYKGGLPWRTPKPSLGQERYKPQGARDLLTYKVKEPETSSVTCSEHRPPAWRTATDEPPDLGQPPNLCESASHL